MSSSFLIFSGHNDRAVIALCRYFTKAGLDFRLVASPKSNFMYNTAYSSKIIYQRRTLEVDRGLFVEIDRLSKCHLVYCPTTEFINHVLVEDKSLLDGLDIEYSLPEKEIYSVVTGKYESQQLLFDLKGLFQIDSVPAGKATAPCVLKPYVNIINHEVLYPIFCNNEAELEKSLGAIDVSLYFSQPYIDGKSYYLCGYLSRSGAYESFWQENLVQQAGGKSIVLACETENPGVREQEFFGLLHDQRYFGPVMLEVMVYASKVYYIEINPRFWGPLQLTLDACPSVLNLFAKDNGVTPPHPVKRKCTDRQYYAWRDGAKGNLRNYSCLDAGLVKNMAEKFDVFSGNDIYCPGFIE